MRSVTDRVFHYNSIALTEVLLVAFTCLIGSIIMRSVIYGNGTLFYLTIIGFAFVIGCLIPAEYVIISILILFQLNPIIPKHEIGLVELNVYDIFYVVLATRALFSILTKQGSLPRTYSVFALSFFLIWCICSTANAYNMTQYKNWVQMNVSLVRFIEYASAALFVPTLIDSPQKIHKIFIAFIATSVVQVIISVICYAIYFITGKILLYGPLFVDYSGGKLGRLSGIYGDPATLGEVLLLPFLLSLLMHEAAFSKISVTYPFILIIGIIFTRTRSAILGLFASLIALLIQRPVIGKEKYVAIGLTLISILVVIFTMQITGFENNLQGFFRVEVDDNITSRVALNIEFLNMFMSSPFLGLGWTGSGFNKTVNAAASLYIHILADLGISGFILLLGFFVALLYDSFTLLKYAKTQEGMITARWINLSTLAFLGISFGDITFYGGSEVTSFFFITWGLLQAAIGMERKLLNNKLNYNAINAIPQDVK